MEVRSIKRTISGAIRIARAMTQRMKAAIYARVSTEDQNLDSQLQSCRDWCSRMKLEAVEYLEKASGASVSRQTLDRLMADVRRGRVKVVVCFKLDRLGRSLVHLAQMIGEFDAYGTALVCPSQGIDTRADNPAGRLQMHVLMAVAEFERSLIRERTRAGLASARARGARLGRPRGSNLNLPVDECRAALALGMSLRAFARAKGLSASSLRRALAA
jgi:DNA invertase Pin-like site-specific DNA recombinase